MTFLPLRSNVFFCRLGLNTLFVRRKEKLTLWPYCLPLPVNSQRDAIILKHFPFVKLFLSYTL